jgi:putative transposase
VVDNGGDYISGSLRYFCNNVGTRIEYSSPREPNAKPHVERFFYTLNTKLIHIIPGTTFSNPTDRKDYTSEKYACITLPDLRKLIEEWVDTEYHPLIHQGHGRAPIKLWNESLKKHPVITYSNEDLDILARNVETRTISGGRIKAHHLKWYSHALATVEHDLRSRGIKPEVEVSIDETDLGHIYVRDPRDNKVIIRADSVTPEYADGLSLYEHNLIRNDLKNQGEKDIQHLGKYAREKARWKLWNKIVEYGEIFGKKQLARLKENKNNMGKADLAIRERSNNPGPANNLPPSKGSIPTSLLSSTQEDQYLPETVDIHTEEEYTYERI